VPARACPQKILGLHTAACTVTEDEHRARRIHTVDMCVRDAERRMNL
jgi:hypothetical protein